MEKPPLQVTDQTPESGENGVYSSGLDFSYDVDSDGLEEQEVDIDSNAESEDSAAAEDMQQQMAQALAAFSDEEVDAMEDYLKERGMVAWLTEYVLVRRIPIRKLLLGLGVLLSKSTREGVDDMSLLPLLKVTLIRMLRRRDKLAQYNSVQDVINLLKISKRIIVLTGAGISVSCGIPDFRSSTGLYALLAKEGKYELDDPQQMFDINYFKEFPQVFYSFASQIYPSNFVPSPCHRFIKVLETRGQLLRNYTQNIDTLESILGVEKVLQCHGSFATASCLQCRRQVPGSAIEKAIFAREVAYCEVCADAAAKIEQQPKKKSKKKTGAKPWDSDGEEDLPGTTQSKAIMKANITFFGEALTDRFDKCLNEDREKVDLLLVIGTSLKVAPVAEILTHLPHSIPQVTTVLVSQASELVLTRPSYQILINKTPVPHVTPDVVLLGDADGIIKYLCGELAWPLPGAELSPTSSPPQRVGDSHVWLFDGAEGGKWVDRIRAQTGGQTQEGGSSTQGDAVVQQGPLKPDPIQRVPSNSRNREDSDDGRDSKRPRIV